MKKCLCVLALIALLSALALAGCSAAKRDVKDLADGTYEASVTLTGGTGRARVVSPAEITVKGGQATARIVWSSSNYDYMLVGGTKYTPVTLTGGSTFEIPIAGFDQELPVTGDTTAMGDAHEISYTLNFSSASLKQK
jgi:hypothetical protein